MEFSLYEQNSIVYYSEIPEIAKKKKKKGHAYKGGSGILKPRYYNCMVLYVHWVVMALTHHESDLMLYVCRGGVLPLLVYFQLIVSIPDNC